MSSLCIDIAQGCNVLLLSRYLVIEKQDAETPDYTWEDGFSLPSPCVCVCACVRVCVIFVKKAVTIGTLEHVCHDVS